MRALVQRVVRGVGYLPSSAVAAVRTAVLVGAIDHGLCVLVRGATHTDDVRVAGRMADKIAGLRIFDDDDGVMNRSVVDVGGAILVVSQFTLYGSTARGRRPSWIEAAPPDAAEPLVDTVVAGLEQRGLTVATGRFRTDMQVELVNDGPVTVMLEL